MTLMLIAAVAAEEPSFATCIGQETAALIGKGHAPGAAAELATRICCPLYDECAEPPSSAPTTEARSASTTRQVPQRGLVPSSSPPPSTEVVSTAPAGVATKVEGPQAGFGSVDNPYPMTLGVSRTGQLEDDEFVVMATSIPAGDYKLIVDLWHPDWDSTNIQGKVSTLDADGVETGRILGFNEIGSEWRKVHRFTVDGPTEMGFKVLNTHRTPVKYWVTLLPADHAGPYPFRATDPPEWIGLDQTHRGRLDPEHTTYFAIDLPAGSYRAIVELANSAGQSTNIQGSVRFMDGDGGAAQRLIGFNEIDASYRKAGDFVLEEPATVVLGIQNDGKRQDYSIKVRAN